MRIDLTIAQIEAIKAHFGDALDDDERLWLDTLEGETDAHELIVKLLDRVEEAKARATALAEQIKDRSERRARFEAQERAARAAIMSVMRAAELRSLTLPQATLSVRDLAARLVIADAGAVPDDFTVIKRVPDSKAINDAFAEAADLPNWLTREAGRSSLTVRVK